MSTGHSHELMLDPLRKPKLAEPKISLPMPSAKFPLFFVFSLLSISLFAQNISDDFSDGDLFNPSWEGDLDDFAVENEQLRLQAADAGESFIFLTATTATEEAVTYEFFTLLDFAPSASNFATIELAGLAPDGEAVSYTLRVGGISGDQDALVLSVDYNGTNTPLIMGTAGAVGTAPAQARIRLSRSAANVWTLAADYTGGTNFATEGSSSSDPVGTIPAALSSFGYRCNYTATRADAFYLDDLNIGPIVIDTEAPILLSAEVTSATQIRLEFSESLAAIPLESLSNYNITPTDPALLNATVSGSFVELDFAGPLPVGEPITVEVIAAIDNSGNQGGPFTENLTITPITVPRPGNLLITEFMADPSPPLGLPNAEYVEIYNLSDTVMNLAGLQLSSGGTPQPITAMTLEPGTYATIVDVDIAGDFAATANVIVVPSFPALTNGGDVIELTYNGQLIQQINYTDNWYDDPDRANGGYSLELTDLMAEVINCQGQWAASRSGTGGTPGQQNSVAGQRFDNVGPALLSGVFSPGGVSLLFDESLAPNTDIGAFTIEPDLGILDLIDQGDNRYLLALDLAPENSTLYTITVTNEIQDCAGNFSAAESIINLGIAEEVELGDVVINELLFNPFVGGVDFVEIFNCSDKILDVEGWTLANNLAATGSPRERINTSTLLLPGGYLVFTPSPENILANYPDQAQLRFLIDQRLPSLPDDMGNISLEAPDGSTLDSFDYNEDQHSALIGDEDGVSLERINPKGITQSDGNWFSAASRVGFATPTRVNSQRRDVVAPAEGNDFFFLDEDIVSPDGDGFQDVLLINYEAPTPGWNARIRIFDANGRLVKVLSRTELLAGSGSIIWDGTTDDNLKAKTGIYVLLIERFEPAGGVETEKLVAVVANQ